MLNKILNFVARTDVFFYSLLWLMVLLTVGTIAQKSIGLYLAQEKYFSSYIVFLGDFIPAPGGYSVMGFMFISLFFKLLKQKWNMKNMGTIITHVGALMLLFGGFLTAAFSYEGNMIIKEGQSSSYISDYHEVELAFIMVVDDDVEQSSIFEQKELKVGNVLSKKELPFNIKINQYCKNCNLVKVDNPSEELMGFAAQFSLKEIEASKEDEENISGITFEVTDADEADGIYSVFEDMPIPQYIRIGEQKVLVDIRHKRTQLPFSVKLLDFEQVKYAGTEKAKSYSSEVILQGGDLEWRSLIAMNEPLRYKGYTFFQASFLEGSEGDTTVLAVVKNIGRMFPYISSIIMCIGLLVHLFQRLPRMFKKNGVSALFLAFAILPSASFAEDIRDGYESFASIPVLHEGRVKPLDTFARAFLININGKYTIKDDVTGEKLDANKWLVELLFNPANSYKRDVFNIPNPEVLNVLGLDWREGHRYSFVEVSKSIEDNYDVVAATYEMPDKQRTLAQQQLVDTYIKTLWFFELSRSVSLLQADYFISDAEIAKRLGVKANENFTYLDLLPNREQFITALKELVGKKITDMTEAEKELVVIGRRMQIASRDNLTKVLRIIPPQWERDGNEWRSPWATLEEGQGSPATAAYLDLWQKMAEAYNSADVKLWSEASKLANYKSVEMAGTHADNNKLKLEVFYNKLDAFKISLAFYIASFMAFVTAALGWKKYLYRAGLWLMASGAIVHFIGIVMRMYIMDRPPVTTLYESIISVAFIAIVFALYLERKRKDGVGIFIGSVMGCILQFVGMRYASEGDTMGILNAVLNTNFWLATHVVTITIGYGCSFVAGAIAHVYLWQRLVGSNNTSQLNSLMKNMLGVGLFALFFSVFGTILGGIWADQSWGRFWGWDPKENGAMLICLWLIWLLHGRIAGVINAGTFAVGMVFTNVIVALAWFGVNLLNVGLHSYGFTSNIAANLAAFCGAEIVFMIVMYGLLRKKAK